MAEKPRDARYPEGVDRSLFFGLIPDDMTAQHIEGLSKQGFTLVGVKKADDPTSMALHFRLERQYGKIYHYMLSAYENRGSLGWGITGINLYFTYPQLLEAT